MTATALERRWQVIESAGESEDLASCLTGPNGLELVVEMAHDLRSPLTSILFLAESLRSGPNGPTSDAQRRQLGLIYSAALCLCTAANDVLELARGGDRLADKAPRPFSIVEVFGSIPRCGGRCTARSASSSRSRGATSRAPVSGSLSAASSSRRWVRTSASKRGRAGARGFSSSSTCHQPAPRPDAPCRRSRPTCDAGLLCSAGTAPHLEELQLA